MSNSTRRGMSPVLAFFLGLLFGIIILAGTVVGAVFIALNYKLDKIQANKDENGEYLYVNANPENGGVANLLELIGKVREIAGDPSSLTLGEVEELLPVTHSLTDRVYSSLEQYAEIDKSELQQVKFSEFSEYFKDKIMDVRPAALLNAFGNSVPDNKFADLVLYGKEANYIGNMPVWYDLYVKNSSSYVRSADGYVLPEEQEEYITEEGDESRLYFYRKDVARNNDYYITVKDGEGCFTATSAEEYIYAGYNDNTAKLTGNYYKENGERFEVTPVTLGSLTDGSALSALSEIHITEFLESGNKLTDKVAGDITVGDIMNGSVDFNEIINGLSLDDILDVNLSENKPDSTGAVLSYLVYGVSDITEESGAVAGKEYMRKGVYNAVDGEKSECFIVLDGLKITEVFTADDAIEIIDGTKVNEINARMDGVTKDLKIGQLMNVTGNKFMEAISESTVDSLPQDINNLALNELYADDIYTVNGNGTHKAVLKLAVADNGSELGEDEIVFNPTYLYYEMTDGGHKLVKAGTEQAGKLTEEEFAEGRYYTYGEPNSTWKIMLYTDGEDGDKTEKAYSVNNVTSIVSNVTKNTQTSTIRELYRAGILTFEDTSVINTPLIFEGERTTVGALTLQQFIGHFIEILQNPAFGMLLG